MTKNGIIKVGKIWHTTETEPHPRHKVFMRARDSCLQTRDSCIQTWGQLPTDMIQLHADVITAAHRHETSCLQTWDQLHTDMKTAAYRRDTSCLQTWDYTPSLADRTAHACTYTHKHTHLCTHIGNIESPECNSSFIFLNLFVRIFSVPS